MILQLNILMVLLPFSVLAFVYLFWYAFFYDPANKQGNEFDEYL